ncbi:MAG: hypothetical protein ACPHIA_07810 [Alphaproteobacteria bacterium]
MNGHPLQMAVDRLRKDMLAGKVRSVTVCWVDAEGQGHVNGFAVQGQGQTILNLMMQLYSSLSSRIFQADRAQQKALEEREGETLQ